MGTLSPFGSGKFALEQESLEWLCFGYLFERPQKNTVKTEARIVEHDGLKKCRA